MDIFCYLHIIYRNVKVIISQLHELSPIVPCHRYDLGTLLFCIGNSIQYIRRITTAGDRNKEISLLYYITKLDAEYLDRKSVV